MKNSNGQNISSPPLSTPPAKDTPVSPPANGTTPSPQTPPATALPAPIPISQALLPGAIRVNGTSPSNSRTRSRSTTVRSPAEQHLVPYHNKRLRVSGPTKLMLDDRINHTSVITIAMNDFRKKNILCDFTIQTLDRDIPAHKIVLCSSSLHFAGLVDPNVPEINRIKVEIDGSVMENLIDFTYTGRIEVTMWEAQEMLVAAKQLEFITVTRACIELIKRNMTPETCLSLRNFSKTIVCEKLKLAADNYIMENFKEFASTADFCRLTFTQVWELISSDNLHCDSEDVVFEAMMSWVRYDLPVRLAHLKVLFSAIRLPLIPIRYLLTKVETDEVLTSDSTCNTLLHKAKNYHLLPEGRTQFVIPGPALNPMRSRLVSSVLYAVGGEAVNGSILKSVECYSPETSEWISVASMKTERSGGAVAYLQGYIYTCGGCEHSYALNTVERYDIYKDRWSFMPAMKKQRSCAGAAVYDNCLYVMGGNCNSTTLNTVERFDPRDNCWSVLSSMQLTRNGVGVVQCKGFIYAMGGHDGGNELKSCERFNIRMNRWETICSMNNKRSYAAVGVINSEIVIAGGFNGTTNMNLVEKYDPLTDSWSLLTMLSSPRSYAGCGVIGDNLYLVGGCDTSRCLKTVEMFDMKLNKWNIVESINVPRACCGVTGICYTG